MAEILVFKRGEWTSEPYNEAGLMDIHADVRDVGDVVCRTSTTVSDCYNYGYKDEIDQFTSKFMCNYCGTEDFASHKHTPHCPNCGALMTKVFTV